MREVKHVIAFDLFGTLMYSTYDGPKYYELLETHGWGFSPDYVRAVIRGQMMNFHPVNWDMRLRRTSDEPLDEKTIQKEYTILLAKRLGNSFDAPPDAHNVMSASSWNTQQFVSPAELVRCWKEENDALQWIDGAQRAIESLKSDDTVLVLVANITIVGMYAVYNKFPEIGRMFTRCYWSCELPTAKPDPYVWRQIERQYVGTEYWMVGDDPLVDLAVPHAMGWKTILVGKNATTLADIPRMIKE